MAASWVAVENPSTLPPSAAAEPRCATPPGDASVLTFQWQKKSGKKWANVAGATGTTFDVATYAATDAGSYRVKINSTNGATEKISAVAVVTTA